MRLHCPQNGSLTGMINPTSPAPSRNRQRFGCRRVLVIQRLQLERLLQLHQISRPVTTRIPACTGQNRAA